MLGLVVLPFSAMYEIFTIWIFGKIWCSIWLAVDVWMCTASILHLVVISLDRYMAVTHPITYPNLMTSKKAKLLIAGAWIMSFVICFPPLVGWKDSSSSETEGIVGKILKGEFANGTSGIFFAAKSVAPNWNITNHLSGGVQGGFFVRDIKHSIHNRSSVLNVTLNMTSDGLNSEDYTSIQENYISNKAKFLVASELQSVLDRCQPKCGLTQDPGYVIYSAVGSFYAPMLIMVFLNWKIYRTALKTTKAIRQGWTKVKGVSGGPGNAGQIEMGIHRGGVTKNSTKDAPIIKAGSCRIGNKKTLQNQMTCPSLTSKLNNGSNNLLSINNSANDRRLSLNVPLRTSTPYSPNKFKQAPKDKHQIGVPNSKNNKQPEQIPLLLTNQQQRVSEKSQTPAVNSIPHEDHPSATTEIDKGHMVPSNSIFVSHSVEVKNGPRSNIDKLSNSKEIFLAPHKEHSPKTSLSSSISHTCIDNISKDNKKIKHNNESIQNQFNLPLRHIDSNDEFYSKTHSLTSIPNCERSLDHLMNHTNLLLNSSVKSKRLNNKRIKDENDHINVIAVVGPQPELKNNHYKEPSENPTSSALNMIGNRKNSEGMVILKHTNVIYNEINDGLHIDSDIPSAKKQSLVETMNRDNDTKEGVRTSVCDPLNVLKREKQPLLKLENIEFQRVNDVKKDSLPFYYNRDHQCRHSRKTFSEQATQTDPKSSSPNDEEEHDNTKNKSKNTDNSTYTSYNDKTHRKLNSSFKRIKFDKLFCGRIGDLKNGLPLSNVTDRKITDNACNAINEEDVEHVVDNSSIDSKRASDNTKPYSCFQCHPRRWSRRKRKLIRCCWKETRHKTAFKPNMMMSFKHANHSSDASATDNTLPQIHTDENGDVTPPNFHCSTEDDIELYPLTGVAAMINQVVNQTVNITAAATGPTAVNNKVGVGRSGHHFGKRNIKSQVRRFRMETKAAKTLGIIIGCFICCWFPFFTIYLIAAFCSDCIPELVFDIFFWLGYCNSALNPFIYAMFSREFRGAFKKIFYKLVCMKYEETVNAHSIVSAFTQGRNMDFNTGQSNTKLGNSNTTNICTSRK